MSTSLHGDNILFKNAHGDGNTINLKHVHSAAGLRFQSDVKWQEGKKIEFGKVYMVQEGNNMVWKTNDDDSVLMTLEP